MSNSKLTSGQKIIRKELISVFPDVQVFSFPDMKVTVGIRPTVGDMAEFAISIASRNEVKFRRKVGEYAMLNRFDSGNTQPVFVGNTNPEYVARLLAEAVGY